MAVRCSVIVSSENKPLKLGSSRVQCAGFCHLGILDLPVLV